MQNLTLSQQIRKQLYQRIIDDLSKNTGNWILPPLSEMARQYNTTTTTMKKVVDSFKSEGIIVTQRGRRITVLRNEAKIMTAKQQSRDIGFLFPKKFEVTCGQVSIYLRVLAQQMMKYNYGIRLLPVDLLSPQDFYDRNGGNDRICGFIGLSRLPLEYISFFYKNKYPFVWINNYIPESSVPAVTLNKIDYFTKIVDYVIDAGHSNVWFIEHSMKTEDIRLWKQICSLKGHPAPEVLSSGRFCNAQEGFEWVYNVALKKFQTQTLADLIITGGEVGTFGVLNAAHDCGIAIPEKIKILPLVDNSKFSCYCPFKTDFLLRPVEKIADQAISLLDSIIHGRDVLDMPYMVDCEIIKQSWQKVENNK